MTTQNLICGRFEVKELASGIEGALTVFDTVDTIHRGIFHSIKEIEEWAKDWLTEDTACAGLALGHEENVL